MVNRYLLDTNICIYFMKGMFNLKEKLQKIELDNLFISEITLAELKYGVENSQNKDQNRKTLEAFINGVQIVPIFHSLDVYASEKARLKKLGNPLDDFDLLIGATAVNQQLTMVTNNTKHFERMQGLRLEDWTLEI
jgi:tRNA(fMet)-specific endonuclease VapC